MTLSWLDALSGLDRMVLGSIVGSVILAFLLLIMVFSVKIKSQQDRIVSLRAAMAKRGEEVETLQQLVEELQEQKASAQAEITGYQRHEAAHQQVEEKLRHTLEKTQSTTKELRGIIATLTDEKEILSQTSQKTAGELQAAQDEIEAVLKRNEFWVEQLSELRTKHEALKLTLRKRERTPS